MSETTSTERAVGQRVRVSVVAGDRRMDIAAPAGVPVVEITPGLARHLNMLEAGTAYAGYRLTRADGHELDDDRSLQAQGVVDGDVLTLVSGVDSAELRVYDDIVEAVADVVESEQKPWSPQDAATTAVLAAVTLLTTVAIMLTAAGLGGASALVTVAAALTSVILLFSAAVIGRIGGPPAAPVALVQVAALYAAVAGFTLSAAESLWGAPALYAGAGAAVTGVLGLLLLRDNREFTLVPAILGAAVAAVGAIVEFTGFEPGHVLAIAVAVAGLAGIGIPWLALSATPLRVATASADEEILADPEELDAEEVAGLWHRGHRIQVSLRIAVALLTLIATPMVLGTGLFGLVLLLLAYAGMILSVRESYARFDVGAVMSLAVLGLALTGVVGALLHPTWRIGVTLGVGIVAAAIVGLSLVAPKQRLWLGRLADAAELACLALLLPAAIVAAGLV
ncbi:EsaB/YukD family protein [Pseudactinotalea sp. Z1732]|uniref:EsaB/YukD family protein n=1 Tax=Pseudactinotalea sp. Z1732 TaxID=3413026 RepID=UPI003C79A532